MEQDLTKVIFSKNLWFAFTTEVITATSENCQDPFSSSPPLFLVEQVKIVFL